MINKNNRRNFLSKILLFGSGALAILSTTGCSTNGDIKNDNNIINNDINIDGVSLTDEQKEKILYIYQEEKLARDVYIYLGNQYPDENTFASIQLAEQRHMDSAQRLCEGYGIDISEIIEIESDYGYFIVPELQSLYDDLILQSGNTLAEALAVGVIVEETDIADLLHIINGGIGDMPSDVINIYHSLLEGSYNHLESFNRRISKL